jgi:exodeoxyribonuclease VII small subunit
VPQRKQPSVTSPSYEELLERLQQVVARLEAGELPLAESLALYEEGVALSAQCQQLLETAELRVQQLQAGAEGIELQPWAAD